MILLNLLDCFVSLEAQSIDRSSKFLDFLRDFFSKAAHWGTNCARENGNFPQKKKEEEAFFLGFLTWVHFSSYSDTYRVFYEEGAGGCSECPVESFTVLRYITALGIYLKK